MYEYLLSKLSASGVNGQFRTPRHIIDMIIGWSIRSRGSSYATPRLERPAFWFRH
jgi:type I restriction enzyme M protein